MSVCAPLEWALVCIWGKRWVDISGQGRDGYGAMDKVCENLALLRGVFLPSAHLSLDQRDKAELRGC